MVGQITRKSTASNIKEQISRKVKKYWRRNRIKRKGKKKDR